MTAPASWTPPPSWAAPVAVGLGAGALGWFTSERPADLARFAGAGRAVLAGHLSGVYGDAGEQAGPLQLLLARLLTVGTGDAGPARIVLAAVDALLAVLVLTAARRRGRSAVLPLLYVAVWLAGPSFWGGHPVEVLIPLLWLLAASRRRPVIAALALAAAAALAPWGLLGFVCVLRRDAARASLVTMAAAVAATAAVYAPFLLAGHSAAGHVWPVSRASLVHRLLPHLAGVGWDFRLGQGLVVLAAAAVLAWFLPAGPLRVPALVTGVALLRVATDPLAMGYYWVPVGAGVVILLLTVPGLRSRAGAGVLAVAYLAWAASPLGLGPAAALGGLAALVAASYSPQMRSSSRRNRAAGSAVLGPSR